MQVVSMWQFLVDCHLTHVTSRDFVYSDRKKEVESF